MSNPSITVYRTRSCPFCVATEDLLKARQVDFDEVYLDDHPDRRAFTAQILPGHDSVPLVLVGDRPIGGFDDLRALDAAGRLDAVLRGEE